MRLTAIIDPCNRVWIETVSGERVCHFPQGKNKTQGRRIHATAQAMVDAFNVQYDSEKNVKMWPEV